MIDGCNWIAPITISVKICFLIFLWVFFIAWRFFCGFFKMFHVESFKGSLGVFRDIGWNIVRNEIIFRKQIPIRGVNSLNFFECSFVSRSEFFSEALGFKKRNVSYGTFLWYIFRKSLFHVENLSTKFKVSFISVAGSGYFPLNLLFFYGSLSFL